MKIPPHYTFVDFFAFWKPRFQKNFSSHLTFVKFFEDLKVKLWKIFIQTFVLLFVQIALYQNTLYISTAHFRGAKLALFRKKLLIFFRSRITWRDTLLYTRVLTAEIAPGKSENFRTVWSRKSPSLCLWWLFSDLLESFLLKLFWIFKRAFRYIL